MFIRNLLNKPIIYKILIILLSLFVAFLSVRSLIRIVNTTAPDFSLLWISSYALIHKLNPYTDPRLFTLNAYPPSAFFFYIPLALIPYQIAQGLFTIINFLAVVACVFLSLKIVDKKFDIYKLLLLLSLTLLSFPTKFTLGMGQINMIAFFFVLLSFHFYKKDNEKISGILLGIACVFKASLGFFLLFYVLKGKWKIVLYTLLIPILATLFIISAYSINSYIYWIKDIFPQLTGVLGREVYYNQGIIGFISRLTTNLKIRSFVYTSISIILISLSGYITKIKNKNKNLQFSFFALTLLFVDIISWQHHFVWIIFSFIVLVKYALKLKSIIFWITLTIAYLLISWNFKNPQIFSTFPKSLLLSNTFYGVILIYFLSLYYFITTLERQNLKYL